MGITKPKCEADIDEAMPIVEKSLKNVGMCGIIGL